MDRPLKVGAIDLNNWLKPKTIEAKLVKKQPTSKINVVEDSDDDEPDEGGKSTGKLSKKDCAVICSALAFALSRDVCHNFKDKEIKRGTRVLLDLIKERKIKQLPGIEFLYANKEDLVERCEDVFSKKLVNVIPYSSKVSVE